jgi:hypothetical protein
MLSAKPWVGRMLSMFLREDQTFSAFLALCLSARTACNDTFTAGRNLRSRLYCSATKLNLVGRFQVFRPQIFRSSISNVIFSGLTPRKALVELQSYFPNGQEIKAELSMKKIVSIALLGAAVTLAPVASFAGSDACHMHKGKKHCASHEEAHHEMIGVGAGALAGAAVGGPVGAVVGGIAGLFIVKHAE